MSPMEEGNGMNREAVNRARTLIEAATPGEWRCEESVGWDVYAPPLGRPVHVCALDEEMNAEFIAAARTGWPNTLDTLEEAVALLDANDAEMATIEHIATRRGPAHRIDLTNIALCATRVRLATRAFLDAYRAEQS